MDKLIIVMPAYNEANNIADVVKQWYPVSESIMASGDDCKIIIANDGSKDNTWEILAGLQENRPNLLTINKPNSGHGATIMHLYRYALDNGADYVFQTDSDGQTLPDEFWQMWNNRHLYDLQIGSRRGRKDGISRIFVTKVLKLVVLLMFGVRVRDANTPFRLMATDSLKEIIQYVPDDFFLANVAISAIAVKQDKKIAWYPITFRPRQGGINSINMKRIIKIGVKAFGDFKKINKTLKINE